MDCGIGESMDVTSAETGDLSNFECNICFELPHEPIVTLCGHLYCWACLYQWLQLHSHSHECPICKAIIEEDKLVPIYGRGKSNYDPKSRPIPGLTIPNRPMGQRPRTAPPPSDMNYIRPNDLDPISGFMPMSAARYGHSSLSTFFGALPAIFNLQMNGFHDATVYGATSGVPSLFSSSYHGDYLHGFHHHHHHHLFQVEWKPIAWKIIFVFFGFVVLLRIILCLQSVS